MSIRATTFRSGGLTTLASLQRQQLHTCDHCDRPSEVRRFCFQASPNADLRRRLRCRPYSPGKSESASAPDHFLKCCHLDICAHRALDFDRCACRSAQDYGNNDHPWHRWALREGEPYTCCRCEDVNVDWYRPRCVCA